MKKLWPFFAVLPFLLFGFDFSKHSVPLDEILSGGPGKDGIPSLTNPRFVPVRKATFIQDNDRVIGVVDGKEAKAYPVSILSWHEAVNDRIGGAAILVTW